MTTPNQIADLDAWWKADAITVTDYIASGQLFLPIRITQTH